MTSIRSRHDNAEKQNNNISAVNGISETVDKRFVVDRDPPPPIPPRNYYRKRGSPSQMQQTSNIRTDSGADTHTDPTCESVQANYCCVATPESVVTPSPVKPSPNASSRTQYAQIDAIATVAAKNAQAYMMENREKRPTLKAIQSDRGKSSSHLSLRFHKKSFI
ncbi:hypothetical protein AB6A40_007514 [Gnathostoma spinigerum]|uniref:Uncharacterized protein n=1 Tax=Gnathostoma spinigerum TaxID=75299 RepID=A0ABD6EX20_9BILA